MYYSIVVRREEVGLLWDPEESVVSNIWISIKDVDVLAVQK